MFRVILFATLLQYHKCLQWTDSLPNHGSLEMCLGEVLQLPWNFTLGSAESIESIQWLYEAEGRQDEMVAVSARQQFFALPAFSGRVSRLGQTSAGIEIREVTVLEVGSYGVRVTIDDSVHPLRRFERRVNVRVIAPDVSGTSTIEAEPNAEVVWDSSSGQWKPQLACRVSSTLEPSSRQVVWMIPGSQVPLNSSAQHIDDDKNGTFTLLLPNPPPPSGGDYVCTLLPLLLLPSPLRCLPPSFTRPQRVSIHLEGGGLKLVTSAHLESHTRDEVRRATESLKKEMQSWVEKEVDGLRNESRELRGELDSLRAEKEGLERQLAELKRNSSTTDLTVSITHQRRSVVSFYGRLRNTLTNFRGRLYDFIGSAADKTGPFNASTGIFTAPLNGTYFLVGTAATVPTREVVSMHMVKNGEFLGSVYLQQNSRYRTMGSCNVVQRLQVGDKVWLESRSRSAGYSYMSTTFTGFLIAADE